MDSVNVDLRKKGQSCEGMQNWVVWRKLVRYVHRPHIEVEKNAVEKEED